MIKKRFAIIKDGVVRVLTNPSDEELQAADDFVPVDSIAKFKRIPVHKWEPFKAKPAVEEIKQPVETVLEEIKEEIKPEIVEQPQCEEAGAKILVFKQRKKRNKLQMAAIVALVAIVCYCIYLGVK